MEWATVLYTRRENNDFKLVAAPYDLVDATRKEASHTSSLPYEAENESELKLWTEWMTLATGMSLRKSDGFTNGPRFVMLRRKSRCIFGIACYVKDIAPNENEVYCKKGLADNYLFAGFCSNAITPEEDIQLPVDVRQLNSMLYKALREDHPLYEHLDILRLRWYEPKNEVISETPYRDYKHSPLHLATVHPAALPDQMLFNHAWEEVYVWDDTEDNRTYLWDAACEHVAWELANSGDANVFSLYLGMRARNDVGVAPMSADHHKFGCLFNATVRGLNTPDRQIIRVQGTEANKGEEPQITPELDRLGIPPPVADKPEPYEEDVLKWVWRLVGTGGVLLASLSDHPKLRWFGAGLAACELYQDRDQVEKLISRLIGRDDPQKCKDPSDTNSIPDSVDSRNQSTNKDGVTDEEFEKRKAALKRQQQSSPKAGGGDDQSDKKETDWD